MYIMHELVTFLYYIVNLVIKITGLVKSADLLTPSEPDAGSPAPDGNI